MVSLSCGRLFYRLLDNLQSFEKTIIKNICLFLLSVNFLATLSVQTKRGLTSDFKKIRIRNTALDQNKNPDGFQSAGENCRGAQQRVEPIHRPHHGHD